MTIITPNDKIDWEKVSEWLPFYHTTVIHDMDLYDRKSIPTALLMEAHEFACCMSAMDIDAPSGTEERVWVRAWAAIRGYKEYAIEFQPHREVSNVIPVLMNHMESFQGAPR